MNVKGDVNMTSGYKKWYTYEGFGWVFVKITTDEHGVIVKVFADTDSDWRMNSGCVKITPVEGGYEVEGYSGSEYFLVEGGEGAISSYSRDVLNSHIFSVMESNYLTNVTADIISIEQAMEIVNGKNQES